MQRRRVSRGFHATYAGRGWPFTRHMPGRAHRPLPIRGEFLAAAACQNTTAGDSSHSKNRPRRIGSCVLLAAGAGPSRTQYTNIGPSPFTCSGSLRPVSRSPSPPPSLCARISPADAAEHCTAPAAPWLCIRDATLTASPCSVCLRPPCATRPHTAPLCIRQQPDAAQLRPLRVDRQGRRSRHGREGEAGQADGVVGRLAGGVVGGRHVAAVEGVDALHAVVSGQGIEGMREAAEHVEDGGGGQVASHCGVVGDVEEEDRHRFMLRSRDLPGFDEGRSNGSR